jgi:ribonuclease Z
MQFLKHKVRFSRLDAVFISHLHGDHILGLPGLLTTLSMYERNFPLKLFAPANLQEIMNVIFTYTYSRLNFELEFIPTEDYEPGSLLYQTDRYQVRLLPLEHRIFCRGFRFEEINKRPRFDFYKAKALEIPNNYFPLLKQGNSIRLDDGREIHPEEVLRPADPPAAYSYCSDTRYSEALIPHLEGTDLMYHESTFLEAHRARAEETWHSTTLDAARVACRSGARHLLLGHFSARYHDLQPFLDEAQSIFPRTQLAREGARYELKDFLP